MDKPRDSVLCVKVSRPKTHGNEGYITSLSMFNAEDEFDGADPSDEITLTFCRLSDAEYAALPDFEGW